MKSSEIETIKRELRNLTKRPSYERVPIIERAAQIYYLFLKLSKSNLNLNSSISSNYYKALLKNESHLGSVLIKGIEQGDRYCHTLVTLSLYLLYGQPNLSSLLNENEKEDCERVALNQKRVLFNQLISKN